MASTKQKPLTPKEQKFVDAYLGAANGNGREAARKAGYQQGEGALATTASRLLKKANVAAAVRVRQAVQATKGILSADERDQALSDIARDRSIQSTGIHERSPRTDHL